jgi:hypothetical protein
MKTELVLFGKHFSMASRSRRRRLVIIFYGTLAALLLKSWLMGSRTGGGFITIEFVLLVGPILGGRFAGIGVLTGTRGLVEPFSAGKSLKYPDSATILKPSTLLHPIEDLDPQLRIDERAQRRRDNAHFISHGFLETIIAAAFLTEFVSYSPIDLAPAVANRVAYCLLQIGYISSMTLPQAILLWTEPDLEEAQ